MYVSRESSLRSVVVVKTCLRVSPSGDISITFLSCILVSHIIRGLFLGYHILGIFFKEHGSDERHFLLTPRETRNRRVPVINILSGSDHTYVLNNAVIADMCPLTTRGLFL